MNILNLFFMQNTYNAYLVLAIVVFVVLAIAVATYLILRAQGGQIIAAGARRKPAGVRRDSDRDRAAAQQ